MNRESYSKIWTFLAVLVLYTSVNSYLGIQGSPLSLPFPNFEKLTFQLIPLFSLLIFVVTYGVLVLTTNFFLHKNKYEKIWTKKIPLAFNVKPDSYKSKDIIFYQFASLFLFFVIPLLLQIHVIKKILKTAVYVKTKNIYGKSIFLPWADCANSHLFKWPDFSLDYVIGLPEAGEWVTYFPTIQSWLFILIVGFYYIFTVKMLVKIFKTIEKKN